MNGVVLGLFWTIYLLCLIRPVSWSVYFFFAGIALETFAVVPDAITGGANIVPVSVCAPLLVFKIFLTTKNRTALYDALINRRRLGLLTTFYLVTILVTFTAPKLFAGVTVRPLGMPGDAPLMPRPVNIKQVLYISFSCLEVVALHALLLTEQGRASAAKGLIWGACSLVISGVLDVVTAGTSLLAPFRTAVYAMHSDEMILGAKRIIGLTPEASSFGTAAMSTAAILYFIRPASGLSSGWKTLQSGLIGALLLLAALCTSSTAILALCVFAAAACCDLAIRNTFAQNPAEAGSARKGLVVSLAGGMAMVLVLLLWPGMLDRVMDYLDILIFKKTASSSYEARSAANRIALAAFFNTGGYGLGLGSSQTSSWLVALLTSTGLLGTILMLAFIGQCLLGTIPAGDPDLRRSVIGARWAWAVTATMLITSATQVNFGPYQAIIYAFVTAIPVVLRPPQWLAPPKRPMRAPLPHQG